MKICIPIINLRDIKKANKTKADLLELRTDLYKNYNLKNIFYKCHKPAIITIKKNDQKLIQEAVDLKPAYIDINFDLKNKIKYNNLIISYHNYHKTPDFKFLDKLIKKGVNKIAVKINKVEDNLIIAKLLKKYPDKIIALGMGELGIMTRLDKRNKISFFSLNKVKKTAPGQLTIGQKNLKLYGIIGKNIQYTLSPQMHNTGFRQHKINALYQIWDTNNLKIMIQIFREFHLAGASVTVPYKEEIMKYLNTINHDVKKIGAVNTIVNKKNKLYGYNTDWYGITESIKKYIKIKNKKVIVLGQGGAAKAAKYGLEKYGAQVKLLNREAIKNFSGNFDILINATPVSDKLLINKKILKKHQVIFDLIYYKKTKLLREAEKKGCIVMSGLDMLRYQGEKQFKLWTNKAINYEKYAL